MPDVISVTPDNVETALAGLPRIVRLALGFGSRVRRGTPDVTLLDGRVIRPGGGPPGPYAFPVSFLRHPRPDPGHARRQAPRALRPDGPALVQPQHPPPGAPQHLCPLRYRQRLLFGLARSEHDLFLGALRG